MSQFEQDSLKAAALREQAEAAAGPLFIGGEYAEADIVGDIIRISGQCGTACSGSRTRMCC